MSLKSRVGALEKRLTPQAGREVVILVVKYEGDEAALARYQYNGPGQGMTIIIPDNNRGDRTPDVIL